MTIAHAIRPATGCRRGSPPTAKKAGTDPQYIPYLSTWLKDLGYDDDALAPKPKIVWEECSREDVKTPEYQAMAAKCAVINGWGQL